MKQKKQRNFQCLILLICAMLCLASCGGTKKNSTKDLCQTWYEEGNDWASFVLYDDGTCELSSKYGTGTWAVVNDDILKLTDSYGDSNTWKLKSFSSDCLILLSGNENQYENVYWNSPEKSLNAAEETRQKEEEAARLEAEKQPPEIKTMRQYSEDIAWMQYNDKGENYWAIIDKAGNIISRFPTSEFFGEGTAFLDGYSNVSIKDGGYCIIDTKGAILRQYDFSDGERSLLNQAGYSVTVKEVSGFDTKGYQYTIYNRDGAILDQFDYKYELDYNQVEYCGKDVFRFSNIGYFCAQNKTWVDWEAESPVFYGNIATAAKTYYDADKSLYGDRFGGVVALSTTGETTTVYSSYVGQLSGVSDIIDNICVLFDGYRLSAIDVLTGEEYPLAEEYCEKIYEKNSLFSHGSWSKEVYNPSNGRVIVHLMGADENGYVGVFDTKMNLLFGPIEGYAKAYADERMILNEDLVYDTDGNVVFSLNEKGLEPEGSYSCGALLVFDRQNKKYEYLDTDGNLLFEKVNFDDVITVHASEP